MSSEIYTNNMSISTLKKKTNTLYNNMSANKHGFSLNGGYRNQGYIGQTSLSRSLPRTPMKGNVARGSGGCCGTYLRTPIVQSAVVSQNNPYVIKTSSMNTMGMMSSKYRWVRRPFPYASTKPIIQSIQSQSDLVSQYKQKAINEAATCAHPPNAGSVCINKLPNTQRPQEKNTISNYDIPEKRFGLTESQYVDDRFHTQCLNNDPPVKTVRGTPFACNNP